MGSLVVPKFQGKALYSERLKELFHGLVPVTDLHCPKVQSVTCYCCSNSLQQTQSVHSKYGIPGKQAEQELKRQPVYQRYILRGSFKVKGSRKCHPKVCCFGIGLYWSEGNWKEADARKVLRHLPKSRQSWLHFV